jgi:hypothetical protein
MQLTALSACAEPEFLRTQGIDSIESIPSESSFQCGLWHRHEENEDFRIDQHISYRQAIWWLSAGDKKSIPALKINI